MPDLAQRAVTAWFSALQPPTAAADLPPATRPTESHDALAPLVEAFGSALDAAATDDARRLSLALRETPLRQDMTAILAQFGAARVLRVMHWLAEQDLPDSHAIIASLLHDGDPSGRSLRSAVHALTRRASLRQMFAPERIAALEQACALAVKEAV